MSDNTATATPIARPIDQADPTCCAEASGEQEPQVSPEPRLDLPAPDVREAVATAALLADRTRAGIVRMLADGPHCVCELAAAMGEKPNNVSMHLARLRDAGLVRAVRHSGDARWMFYERDEDRCAAAAAAIDGLLR
jgi:ArsR family transcriptional regulator, arsenate/arsenite/antimonite-responsive transcriptional repressor